MPFLLKMPSLSPTMKSGKIVKWCLQEGGAMESGTVIAEIETDKAMMDFECSEEGILVKIFKNDPTEQVSVKDVIGIAKYEDDSEEEVQDFIKKYEKSGGEETKQDVQKEETVTEIIEQKPHDNPVKIEKGSSQRIKASPLARSIAKNNNVDLKQMQGNGPYGRIVKSDVMKYINNNSKSVTTVHAMTTGENRVEKASEMRKVIARRLVESKQQIPHFYLKVDCVLNSILCLRKKINDEKTKITINDFVIKASALAMRELSAVNASWQNDEIIYFASVDVAVAVSLDEGLITPIIRNADQKSLAQLSQEMKSLAVRARESKLQPHEFQGGGFTISNLGMFGIPEFQAIINPPQAAILAVGAGKKSIVIDENDNQTVKTLMTLSLSVDHRVIDGALAANFLNKIKFFLENPAKMLIL